MTGVFFFLDILGGHLCFFSFLWLLHIFKSISNLFLSYIF